MRRRLERIDDDLFDIVEFGDHRCIGQPAGNDDFGIGTELGSGVASQAEPRRAGVDVEGFRGRRAIEHIGVGAVVAIDNITALGRDLGDRVVALPPAMMSLPAPPLIKSLPANPKIALFAAVPVNVSAPAVPLMTA